jgi:hypothetical protein
VDKGVASAARRRQRTGGRSPRRRPAAPTSTPKAPP